MKRFIPYVLFLSFLAIPAGSLMAQSADKTIQVNGAAKAEINTDIPQLVANFEVYPIPTKGMLTIKTECVGKVSFFSLKGKAKGSCLVNEGTNIIYLETVLNPGTYICKFDGVNGSTGEVRVVYQL